MMLQESKGNGHFFLCRVCVCLLIYGRITANEVGIKQKSVGSTDLGTLGSKTSDCVTDDALCLSGVGFFSDRMKRWNGC